MKNYKTENIKKYESLDGSNFEDSKREELIRKIVELAGKLGWRYSQTELIGKSFCVTENSHEYPNGKTTKESVTMTFTWRSSKDK